MDELGQSADQKLEMRLSDGGKKTKKTTERNLKKRRNHDKDVNVCSEGFSEKMNALINI